MSRTYPLVERMNWTITIFFWGESSCLSSINGQCSMLNHQRVNREIRTMGWIWRRYIAADPSSLHHPPPIPPPDHPSHQHVNSGIHDFCPRNFYHPLLKDQVMLPSLKSRVVESPSHHPRLIPSKILQVTNERKLKLSDCNSFRP